MTNEALGASAHGRRTWQVGRVADGEGESLAGRAAHAGRVQPSLVFVAGGEGCERTAQNPPPGILRSCLTRFFIPEFADIGSVAIAETRENRLELGFGRFINRWVLEIDGHWLTHSERSEKSSLPLCADPLPWLGSRRVCRRCAKLPPGVLRIYVQRYGRRGRAKRAAVAPAINARIGRTPGLHSLAV
jgi:hypothetical protein